MTTPHDQQPHDPAQTDQEHMPTDPEHGPMTMDDELDAALASFSSQELPTSTTLDATAPQPSALVDEAIPHPSQTLGALDESRHPKAKTVCEACPNSVWFASPAELKCYCRVMFLVTWSSKEPNQLTHCDGQFLGQD